MKKLICILLALCVLLQPGCTPKKADDTPKNPTQCCSDFIPEGAKGFTFFYSDFSMSTFELQPMSYQADEQKVMQLCTLFDASSFTLLSAEDLLSFSFVSNPEAADFSIWFNSGDEVNDVLLFFQEGVTCRYKSVESDALLHSDLGTDIPTVLLSSSKDEPEYFSVSRDTLHQLQKILIPDFEMGYLSASANLNYIPVEDVNPGSVNEVALYVPPFRRVFPCPDGIIAFHSVWEENGSGTFLRAVKYSKQGEFLWFRDFTDIEPLTYGSVGFVSTNDSGFAFSINGDIASRWIEDTEIPGERKHEAIITPGWLVRCDKDGNIIWQEQVKLSGGSAIEFIFELENGDLLTVGTCQTNEDEYDLDHPTYGFTDLLLMKYNSAGNRTVFRKFGGSDFEFSEGASYSLDVGLVVWGSTQSCDGDITERSEKGTMLYPRQFITVLDDDLNEKWQYVFEGQEEIYDTYLVIADEHIYVAGSLSGSTGKHLQTALFKFSSDGSINESSVIEVGTIRGLHVASDGTFLVAVHRYSYDGVSNNPQVYRLNTDLDIVAIINDDEINGSGFSIVPTDDNGFFTIQYQLVKTLPQPPWMSHLMTDSATVLSRYDANGTLLYRKTYDKYHEVDDMDTVIPLPDGRVIIDR